MRYINPALCQFRQLVRIKPKVQQLLPRLADIEEIAAADAGAALTARRGGRLRCPGIGGEPGRVDGGVARFGGAGILGNSRLR